MAPVARWIFAAVATCVLLFGLFSVPVRVSYFGPEGAVYRDWRRCGNVAIWEDSLSADVREVIGEMREAEQWEHDVGPVRLNLKEARPVAYKRWDAWLCWMAFEWMLFCGLLWPFLWLLRRRPGWLPASRLSLSCLAWGIIGVLLLSAGSGSEGIHTTLILPCVAVLTGRAAAAPEGGAPWLGMVAGERAFGATLLMLAVSLVCALSLASNLVGIVPSTILCLLVAAIGIAPALCLAPEGQSRAWARHFMMVGVALAGALLLTGLLQHVVAAVSPSRAFRPLIMDDGESLLALLLAVLIWVVIVLVGSGVAALYRKFLTPDPS